MQLINTEYLKALAPDRVAKDQAKDVKNQENKSTMQNLPNTSAEPSRHQIGPSK